MRRPSLFALMLAAFITVIVLGACGVGTVLVLSVRLNQGADGSTHPTFAPPWFTSNPTTPLVLAPPASGTALPIPDATPPYEEFRNALDWRGPVSALLAFCAVLLGAATFFSRRVTRPLTRLTRAARTMAGGDLNVRVESSAVREIDDLAGAFNTMATSLSDADRQRRQMTADVAHELRTPLAIIRGRLEGMQDGIYSPTPEQITTLLNETALLERLIEDLRLLALVDTGQLPLHKESISPSFLLESVGRSFAEQARSLGVELRVADLPALPEVEADPQRISQVLGNLIANSLRHTPAGGTVLLNASRDAGAVYVSVSDTGSGIAPEDLPHIFDRFYRADAARTRTGGGAGLGLAIARRLIEAHHGTIRAESAPGQGTVITFSLPLP
ncbi:MAG TPA: ATP-binding protein [Chloroflexia bacterium]|nr:ATP-binding protein [Chloroflexia bacterium]